MTTPIRTPRQPPVLHSGDPDFDLDAAIRELANDDARLLSAKTPTFCPIKLDFDQETLDGKESDESSCSESSDSERSNSDDSGESDSGDDDPAVLFQPSNLNERYAEMLAAEAKNRKLAVVSVPSRAGGSKRKASELYPTVCTVKLDPSSTKSFHAWGMRILPDPEHPRVTMCSPGELLLHPQALYLDGKAYYQWPCGFWAPLLVWRNIPRNFLHKKAVADGETFAVTPLGAHTCGDLYVITDPYVLSKYYMHMVITFALIATRTAYLSEYAQTCAIVESVEAKCDFTLLKFAKWQVDRDSPKPKMNPAYNHFFAYHPVGNKGSVNKMQIRRPLMGRLVNASTGELLTRSDLKIKFDKN